MGAGAWVMTNASKKSMLDGTFDIDGDSFKMALHLSSGTQPTGTTTAWSGLETSEHAEANGYIDGGIAVDLVVTTIEIDDAKVDIDTDPVWTANGGSIVAYWAVIYKVGGNVLCYCYLDDTPADVTVTTGNTLTVAAHASGVFTLA